MVKVSDFYVHTLNKTNYYVIFVLTINLVFPASEPSSPQQATYSQLLPAETPQAPQEGTTSTGATENCVAASAIAQQSSDETSLPDDASSVTASTDAATTVVVNMQAYQNASSFGMQNAGFYAGQSQSPYGMLPQSYPMSDSEFKF